jgi:hypothetical protein
LCQSKPTFAANDKQDGDHCRQPDLAGAVYQGSGELFYQLVDTGWFLMAVLLS